MPDGLGGGPRASVVRHDTTLGAGLVGIFGLLVLTTFWAADPTRSDVVAVVLVEVTTLAVGGAALRLPWGRLPARALLMFPVTVSAGMAALALINREVAVTYAPFLTLGFVYAGLTQSRWCSPALVAVTAPAWALAESPFKPALVVKLCLVVTVWVLIAEALAARAAENRADTTRWMLRANSDGLTGLASRPFLLERVRRALARPGSRAAALLLIDLDGLKTVNDTFGHGAGDELLMAVASRLRSNIRPTDIAARLGGDEFAVLLDGSDLGTASQVAERVLVALGQPISLSRGRLAVTASIGIVALDGQAAAEEVIYEADVAMYEAKSSGRNHTATYRREMQQRLAGRLQLEAELHDALEHEHFEVHYQPILEISSGSFVGVEALVRWRHEKRGLLGPAEFIVAAEETGIIIPLGRWVLKQACAQGRCLSTNTSRGRATVAVNVSAPELYAADFAPDVAAALAETGLPGEALVLEITERLLMADPERARHRLEEIRALGVRVAIDDFGTGYSSLAYLREFPVDILKIDRSFVSHLPEEERSTALLRSILAMASALGLEVVVEGVETSAQAHLLTELGCEMCQGYFFARPMPAEDLYSLLAMGGDQPWAGVTEADGQTGAVPDLAAGATFTAPSPI